MFIEPRTTVMGNERQVRYAGIVICNTRQYFAFSRDRILLVMYVPQSVGEES
jgi:hypothetical protein